jgi:hypothetical protein
MIWPQHSATRQQTPGTYGRIASGQRSSTRVLAKHPHTPSSLDDSMMNQVNKCAAYATAHTRLITDCNSVSNHTLTVFKDQKVTPSETTPNACVHLCGCMQAADVSLHACAGPDTDHPLWSVSRFRTRSGNAPWERTASPRVGVFPDKRWLLVSESRYGNIQLRDLVPGGMCILSRHI